MKKAFAIAVMTTSLATSGLTAVRAADTVVVPEAPVAARSDARDGVRIGYLDCRIGGGAGYVLGSAKEVDCAFVTTMGSEPVDHYQGEIRKLGVDLGFTTQGRLVWAVLAPTAGYHEGSLGGIYQGATAEATVGAGVGANILVGGTSGSIHLQTVSLTGQIGLNIAATGTSMTLTSVN